jgi:hypothetical protein
VKTLRHHAIQQLEGLPEGDPARKQHADNLDDLFFVVQVFSYPGNYVSERPSIERIAETLDKFEEDVLGASTATVRGARKAIVTFGEPVPVAAARDKKAAAVLTTLLEERVQRLLDES